MNLFIMGAPGSGKGTQASRLSKALEIPAISTGAMLRSYMTNGSALGDRVKRYIDAGEYVPDDIMCELVFHRINEADCAGGFILDGFPRTVDQAHIVELYNIRIDNVVVIQVSDEVIIERLSGRLICKSCDAAYHIKHQPPKAQGICDACAGELIIRSDDTHETVVNRLKVYHKMTDAVVDYYKEKGMLLRVDGTMSPDDISKAILSALGREL